MNVAICGNVGQNAFLLAQGLRALGVEADSFDQGGGYALQMPHWHADFDPLPWRISAMTDFWDWCAVERATGWHRPGWAKILGNDGAAPWYDTQEAFQADFARVLVGQKVLAPEDQQRHDLTMAVTASRTLPAHDAAVINAAMKLGEWRSVLAVAAQYDLVVLCGQYAAFAPLLPREQPYVTFEHATMRYTPSLATPTHRLIALAYQQADANVITNADCWEAAGMLGIRDKSVFIPHPLDEQLCSPGDPDEVARQKARLHERLGVELVFLAPARHCRSEASGSKRNDRLLYAYARYVQEAEPAGAPRAALVLCAWGEPAHVQESEALIEALGLRGRVLWLPCLPKARLVRWYRVADVVLDQFSETVGSFGAVTAEAMATGTPVITYYSDEAHAWCKEVLPEPPPVMSARTADDLYGTLVAVARSPHWQRRLSDEGRRWIAWFHGLKRVCRLHLDLYERVLAAKQPVPATNDGQAPTVAELQARGDVAARFHEQLQRDLEAEMAGATHLVETDCGPVGVGA
jgi:glycosyltransferase involved in cell wall biosynthesis